MDRYAEALKSVGITIQHLADMIQALESTLSDRVKQIEQRVADIEARAARTDAAGRLGNAEREDA